MRLDTLFEQKKCVYALEIFPPKKRENLVFLEETLGAMAATKPDYISVTYSAGGGGNKELTAQISANLKDMGVEPLAHLTCVNAKRGEIENELHALKQAGVKNILALRGDRIPGVDPCRDFAHASDLMAEINRVGGFYMAGACYPEGHPESASLAVDVERLAAKVDSGAGHLISQLFFDNGKFFRFLNLARKKGINCPIEAGVMPVVRKQQLERTVSLSSASLPAVFSKMVSRHADDPESFYHAGIYYAIQQIRDLIEGGVDGIHLYAMNSIEVAREIYEGVRDLL